jgi:hypothetical protein
LADLAGLALVHDRGERRADHLVEHTLGTVNDRVHLSQAVVVGATGLDPHQATRAVRAYARRLHRPLPEVVRAITDRQVDLTLVAGAITAVTLIDPDAEH